MRAFLFYCIPLVSITSLPVLHFGVFYRLMFDRVLIDREVCTCECWDRVFKGNYEKYLAGYKHIYFNTTWQTTLIWAGSMVTFVSFYEVMKHACALVSKRRMRWRMVVVFVTCLYPNYYSWWSYFNYLNDEFYSQLIHQCIFTASELYVTILAVIYFDKEKLQNGKLLGISLMITTFHIIHAAKDQFFYNVLMLRGESHQVSRDIGFMIADVSNLILLSHHYRHLLTTPYFTSLNKEEFTLGITLLIIAGVFLTIF